MKRKPKPLRWLLATAILALLSLLPCPSAAADAGQNINPALLYWQAYAVMPDLSDDDQKHFFESEWRNRPMDKEAGQIARRFDATFRLLGQARHSKAGCDWGVDLTDGPNVLLPHLAKAKRCAQAAVLRARWFLQENLQERAGEDLISVFVLGRRLATDQVLISALVQFAIENIVSGCVVQQWPQLRADTIQTIVAGMDSAPLRGTVAICMHTEEVAFYRWFDRKLEQLQATYPANDPRGPEEALDIITKMVSEEGESRRDLAADILAAAGNSLAGLRRYVAELEPFYKELQRGSLLPYAEFQAWEGPFREKIDTQTNLLAHEFLPPLTKVRLKEFRITARLAMLHAALAYRINPAGGTTQVADPFGAGSFQSSRFVFNGVDRGFRLQSQLRVPDFPETLIIAEKAGPAFLIDGPRAGQKVP